MSDSDGKPVSLTKIAAASAHSDIATRGELRMHAPQSNVTPTSPAKTITLPPYVWYVVLLLWTTNVFNYMDRMALAALMPLIKQDMTLSDGQLGLLVGFAFSLFYAICGIPIARLADRSVRRNIIAAAVAVWSAMTAVTGTAQTFWQLFLARIGVGAGEAGSMAPGASILCDYVPLQRRSLALAIIASGVSAGTLVGMALTGSLGEAVGWRWTFVILGLPGLVLALLIRFTLKEPKRGFHDAETAAHPPVFSAALRSLWRVHTYRYVVLFLIANGFVQVSIYAWWPSFYTRSFHVSLSEAGVYLGVAAGAIGGLGVLFGGFIAARVSAIDITLPLKIAAGANALAILTGFSSLAAPTFKLSIALACLTTFLWALSNGPVLAAQYSVVRPEMRATAGAIAIFAAAVLGHGLGPLSVGVLSDVLMPAVGEQSLRYALAAILAFFILTVVALLGISKALSKDLAAMSAT